MAVILKGATPDYYILLLAFVEKVIKSEIVKEIGKEVVKWLFSRLWPELVKKVTSAGIDGAVGTVEITETNQLCLYVSKKLIFQVSLVGGLCIASVLAQLKLENMGHEFIGKAVGATGCSVAGGLLLFFAVPIVPAVTLGALAGFGLWNAFDRCKDYWCSSRKEV